MRIVRNNIFETNSSSTHTLTYLKRGYSLPEREHKKNWQGNELPITMDTPNLKVEVRNFMDGADNSDLTHPEWMASYLFTMLQLMKYNNEWNGEHTEEQVDEALGQFHLMCLANNLIPEYGPVKITYHVYDYNIDGHWPDTPKVSPDWSLSDAYMEFNDGGDIDSLYEIWQIIRTPESFREFLTKGKIKIKYEG